MFLQRVIRNPVVRRVVQALLTLLGVAIFVFIMLRAIPGNQITAGLGTEAAALTPSSKPLSSPTTESTNRSSCSSSAGSETSSPATSASRHGLSRASAT